MFNKSEREAVNQLKLHFNFDFVKTSDYNSVSSVVTKLKVGNKEVYPGQYLIEGTRITLYFGGGRSSNRVIAPLLIGEDVLSASSILIDHNLKMGEIIAHSEITDTLSAIVISQFPLSETKLQTGDMLDIQIKQYIDTIKIIDSLNNI